MEKYTDHSLKNKLNGEKPAVDMKGIAAILVVELGILLLAIYKGIGANFLPVTLMMVIFTILGYGLTTFFHGDKTLIAIVIVLLNLGFLVQQIQSGSDSHIVAFLVKLAIVLMVTAVTAVIYYFCDVIFANDMIILLFMLLQLIICFAMLLVGHKVGGGSQGASISIHGITPFEFVKVLYIFVIVGLLCKEDSRLKLLGIEFDRELLLVVHTIILSLCFAACSELGTLMMVYFSGLMMLWIFGKNRKAILLLAVLSVVGFLMIWFVCSNVLLPLMESHPDLLPGMVSKIVQRFAAAPHPEKAMASYGYQGTKGLEAITLGGLLGIGTERYRLSLPESMNDFVFDNLVETCGMLMGFILIVFLFALLKRGLTIANHCEDRYLRGIATGITILITVESVVHIGYNIAFLPVTGIPLYFMSQGFTATVTGMIMVAIMLVISIKNQKQTVEEKGRV